MSELDKGGNVMKLYAFYAIESADTADFAVIAESEAQARQLVTEYIAAHFDVGNYAIEGWPDAYRVKVREAGQVVSSWGKDV